MTSDGGPAFVSERMQVVMRSLAIDHHVSVAYHPEGHGAVERINFVVVQLIRGWISRDSDDWVKFLPVMTFVINSSFSRARGMSPFKVLHGFEPRSKMHSVLGIPSESLIDGEEELHQLIESGFELVRGIQTEQFEKALKDAKLKARGQDQFEEGDFVLEWTVRGSKLQKTWKGPFLVVGSREDCRWVYQIENLVTGCRHWSHVNRLHIFRLAGQSDQDLIQEAAEIEEFVIEEIKGHRGEGKDISFFVKWMGYPELTEEDEESWLNWPEARNCEMVLQYLQEKGITDPDRRRRTRGQ